MALTILSAPELNMPMSQMVANYESKCNHFIAKVKELKEKYTNTDVPEERTALLMNFIAGDTELYELTHIDTTVIPDIVKAFGDITLEDAALIMIADRGGDINDMAEVISAIISKEDLNVPDPENMTLQNVTIGNKYMKSAIKIRDHFDIRQFMNLGLHLEHHLSVGDFDDVEIILCHLIRYSQLFKEGV